MKLISTLVFAISAVVAVTGAAPIAAPALSQPLTYLQDPDTMARWCLQTGRTLDCPASIIAYCEKHKGGIEVAPWLDDCVRAEQREAQRRAAKASVPPCCTMAQCRDQRFAQLGVCNPVAAICKDHFHHPEEPMPAVCSPQVGR